MNRIQEVGNITTLSVAPVWQGQIAPQGGISHLLMPFLNNTDAKANRGCVLRYRGASSSFHLSLLVSLSLPCLSVYPSFPPVSYRSLMGLHEIFWPGSYSEHIIRNRWTVTPTWGLFSYLFLGGGGGAGVREEEGQEGGQPVKHVHGHNTGLKWWCPTRHGDR